MTTPTKAPPQPAPAATLNTRKFTVDEYYRLAEVGILQPDERVELVNGEILLMPLIGPLHAATVDHWTRIFMERASNRYTVRNQNPVRLGERSEPVPDLAILRYRERGYFGSHPRPEDTLLVIEVADSTLAYDRRTKAILYAQANIPETWIMNLPEECIESFTEPGPEGYAQRSVYRRGDRISPASLQDVEFAVDDLLPPVVEEQGTNEEGGTPTEA